MLIEPSQARTPAGWRNAAWSTARGELGLRHNVATATSTYADAGNAAATAAGGTAVGCGEAARVTVGATTGAVSAGEAAAITADDDDADADADTIVADADETTTDELADVTAEDPCGTAEIGAAWLEQPARKISATINTPADRRPAISPG